MKYAICLLLLIPFLASCGQGEQDAAVGMATPAEAADHVACESQEQGETSQHEVAQFSVEGLDMEMAGTIAASLADKPGIVSARPLIDEGRISVEYATDASNAKTILAALTAAGADAKLLGVEAVKADAMAKAGCAGCPSKSKCQGSGS